MVDKLKSINSAETSTTTLWTVVFFIFSPFVDEKLKVKPLWEIPKMTFDTSPPF
jgi:hypothetical protein